MPKCHLHQLSGRRKLLFTIATSLLVLASLEVICFYGTMYLVDHGAVYTPKLDTNYEHYLSVRDPLLGWPSRVPNPKKRRDSSGARFSPQFPNRHKTPPAVSVYGDSFSWSSGVDDAAAWPEVMSSLIEARVDNFGSGGYGSDQALIRFKDNCAHGIETAPVVILMHLTENILRNVNQYRDFLYRGRGCGFKPRFVIRSDGELEQIPLPKVSVSNFDRFVAHPDEFLEHETFLPGKSSGPVKFAFPYTLTVLRTLSHFHTVAKIRGEPWHKSFYDPNHHSRALVITTAILELFHNHAKERNQQPLVVLLPTMDDLDYHQRTGQWTYSTLVKALAERRISVLDLGPKLQEEIGDTPLHQLYGKKDRHHNKRGYRLVAELIYRELTRRELCYSR